MSVLWEIVNKTTRQMEFGSRFVNRQMAEAYLQRMGPSFHAFYEASPATNDPWLRRILVEGLVAGDLRRIILPQVSIDEYVPGDSESDNVVIAFFIKGVPEAVIPFRDFLMKCRGVLDVAYGDSDTIPNTSIVYVEMPRTDFKFIDLYDMMEQVAMLTQLEVADFSVMFPSSTKRFPYSPVVIEEYFEQRTAKKNAAAQKAALQAASSDQESTGADDEASDRISDDSVKEAMLARIIESFGN